MGNSIKYGTTASSGTVLKGNILKDVGGVSHGSTAQTGWWASGINQNGYTITLIKSNTGPQFWCPANDTEVLLFCNMVAVPSPPSTITSIDDALIFLQKSNYMVDYRNSVTRGITSIENFPSKLPMDGLSCYLDAQIDASSGTANKWFDMSGNGLEFQSYGNSLSLANLGGYKGFQFNGSGYFQCNDKYGSVNMGGDCTLVMWLWAEGISERDTVFEKAGTGSGTGGGTSYQQEIAVTWETSNSFSYYSRKTPKYDSAGGSTCTLGAWNMISIKMSTGLTSAARTGFRSKNGGNYAASYSSRSNVAIVPSAQIRVGTGYAGPVEGGNGVGAILTYNKMLSNTEIAGVWDATKGRFGL
tara:strand:+ start:278 stop:1348 length:1071 start_codon:yes stop_codon:yes gene_type:complete